MPLGTLDRRPPPFFKQGASALSKLLVCSALALLLMAADARLQIAQPLRSALATALQPLQWLALMPGRLLDALGERSETLSSAQSRVQALEGQLLRQAPRAQQAEQLALENRQLRELLDLRARGERPSLAAEITHEAADPYTRKVFIDRGALAGVLSGAPVIDALGVIGQVTRVHPMASEVTLLTDREQAIPVINTRTGQRSVAFGEPAQAGALELRFMAANADVQQGDLLATSGVDGIYPPGLAVARVTSIERRADSGFARIRCEPLARVSGTRHVLVLEPLRPITTVSAADAKVTPANPATSGAAGSKKAAP